MLACVIGGPLVMLEKVWMGWCRGGAVWTEGRVTLCRRHQELLRA